MTEYSQKEFFIDLFLSLIILGLMIFSFKYFLPKIIEVKNNIYTQLEQNELERERKRLQNLNQLDILIEIRDLLKEK